MLARIREVDRAEDETENTDPNYLEELLLPMIFKRDSRDMYLDASDNAEFEHQVEILNAQIETFLELMKGVEEKSPEKKKEEVKEIKKPLLKPEIKVPA